jgi:hypothetical protein
LENPPLHQFPVFSVIRDDDSVVPKFVQCPNCGAVHKVTDIFKSEIVPNKEDLRSLTIQDMKAGFSESLSGILETNDCDLSIWEFVKFIIDNQKWGEIVVLTSESIDGMRQGKYLRILGERLYKVEEFVREEFIR